MFEDGFPGYSTLKPDLVLLEQDLPNEHFLWRAVLCYFEVKFTATDGPIRTKSLSAGQQPRTKAGTAQTADYARLHMSLRPFQLFSIGCLIFSSSFTVSVFDRGGVLHSQQMKVFDDSGVTDDFIKVMLRLVRDLTVFELGRDPTVATEDTDPSIMPTFNVGLTPLSPPTSFCNTRWSTVGHPIWTSYSLLGRGTTVWKVLEKSSQPSYYILKTAWRHTNRVTESKIYQSLKELKIIERPGIAVFVDGQDVVGSGSTGDGMISVNSLRPVEAQLQDDIILHRVILSSVGKPLWQYDTPSQFIRGLLAAIDGQFNWCSALPLCCQPYATFIRYLCLGRMRHCASRH